MGEQSTISIYDIEMFRVISIHKGNWLTNAEIHEKCVKPKPTDRTVRNFTKRMTEIGLLREVKVSPGHRFTLAGTFTAHAIAYRERLLEAAYALGVVIA